MLTRLHNEVINMFMNQINHTLTPQLSAAECQIWWAGKLLHPDSATGLCCNGRGGEKSERAGEGLHAQTAFVSLCMSFDRHIKCVKGSQVPGNGGGEADVFAKFFWGEGRQESKNNLASVKLLGLVPKQVRISTSFAIWLGQWFGTAVLWHMGVWMVCRCTMGIWGDTVTNW